MTKKEFMKKLHDRYEYYEKELEASEKEFEKLISIYSSHTAKLIYYFGVGEKRANELALKEFMTLVSEGVLPLKSITVIRFSSMLENLFTEGTARHRYNLSYIKKDIKCLDDRVEYYGLKMLREKGVINKIELRNQCELLQEPTPELVAYTLVCDYWFMR